MESSKQEMELFLLFPDLRSKKLLLQNVSFTNQSITGFRNGKWKTKLEQIKLPTKLVAFSYVPNKAPG